MRKITVDQYLHMINTCGQYAHMIELTDKEVAHLPEEMLEQRQITINTAQEEFPEEVQEMQCPIHGYALRSYFMGAVAAMGVLADCDGIGTRIIARETCFPQDIVDMYRPLEFTLADSSHNPSSKIN